MAQYKFTFSVIKNNSVIAAYKNHFDCDSHTKHIKALCGQNVEFLVAKY